MLNLFDNLLVSDIQLNREKNVIKTENGDKALSTSGSKCLDFFVRITRNAPVPDYVPEFFNALKSFCRPF